MTGLDPADFGRAGMTKLDRLTIADERFVDTAGRSVMLRGVNLGGDCKVPYPNGGTNFPSDFSDHREVSFVGRPFPLAEADEHFGRLKAWGMNCLRLLTTWEAVEYAGPGKYDAAYLDYFAEIAGQAGEHGLYVFIDFHQDVWSRMSGGDGAPGWTFEAVGLDFTTFNASGAAHVMQHKYDYAKGGRQDSYPMMTWSQNYAMPANAIMWTLFFAGDLFVPEFKIEGRTAQDFLQSHYLGAMREIAKRVKGMPHVLGFDTLNEPGTGWTGQALSYRHTERTAEHPDLVRPGPAWSPLDGLLVARGVPRTIPELAFDPAQMKVAVVGERRVNEGRVSIWRKGVDCPFEAAGAYRVTGNGHEVLREDFFQTVRGKRVAVEADGMTPFFARVAREIRAIDDEWLIFAELDPFRGLMGEGFPPVPERTVNASHWYDIVTLSTKTFMYPASLNPFTMKTLNGADEIEGHYAGQLGRIKDAGALIPGGAPTLIGEFGIPFDLDGAAAYQAWAAGDRSDAPWEKHVLALDLMYNAMDRHLLNCTLWNYTASNRNDAAIGDGWNQEDLSVFSRDQQVDRSDPNSGGRAVAGFVRPFVRRCQGVLKEQKFDRESETLTFAFDADPSIGAPTEVYFPIKFPHRSGPIDIIDVDNRGLRVDFETGIALWATQSGPHTVTIKRVS